MSDQEKQSPPPPPPQPNEPLPLDPPSVDWFKKDRNPRDIEHK
jgi:hypothetical protein